jgi:hypothetical protein
LLTLVLATGALLPVLPTAGAESSRSKHEIFFAQTDHELHVYRIFGREPGNTVLIIGGIHGNEPGGYLAADKYVDLTLRKGNLIIVPRANLSSILTSERGGGGDYNRKFNAELRPDSFDDRVVAVLKQLISESDLLLNLHDGSGFYCETYVDRMHNPYRFGQSVIADSETYYSVKEKRELHLGEIARQVVGKANEQINEKEYHFHFSNHNSVAPDTRYPEMRKTATYFALTRQQIPAFGIETSKELPTLELKLAHQVLVINAFLDEFGIEIDVPDRSVEPPKFDYAILAVNNDKAMVVRDGGALFVQPGDRVRIEHIVGNYERYMFADFLGTGGLNDNGREVEVSEQINVVIRKDDRICGNFKIVPQGEAVETFADDAFPRTLFSSNFIVEINGRRQLLASGGELKVVRGDKLRVLDFIAPDLPQGVNVNFLGFVGNPSDNRGEDRGYLIDTSRDLLATWSLDGKGERYAVAVKLGERELAKMTIRLYEPRLNCLVLRRNDEHPVVLQPGELCSLSEGDKLTILGALSSAPDDSGLTYILLDQSGNALPIENGSFIASSNQDHSGDLILAVMRGETRLGAVNLRIQSHAAGEQTGR